MLEKRKQRFLERFFDQWRPPCAGFVWPATRVGVQTRNEFWPSERPAAQRSVGHGVALALVQARLQKLPIGSLASERCIAKGPMQGMRRDQSVRTQAKVAGAA